MANQSYRDWPRRLIAGMDAVFSDMEPAKSTEAFLERYGAETESETEAYHPFRGLGHLPGTDRARRLEIRAAPGSPARYVEFAAMAGSFSGARTATLKIDGEPPVRYRLPPRYTSPGRCLDLAESAPQREACFTLMERGLDDVDFGVVIEVGFGGIAIRVFPNILGKPKGMLEEFSGAFRKRRGFVAGGEVSFEDWHGHSAIEAPPEDAGTPSVSREDRRRMLKALREGYPWKRVRGYLAELDGFLAKKLREKAPAMPGTPVYLVGDFGIPVATLVDARRGICGPVEGRRAAGAEDCGWEFLEAPYLGPRHFR